MMFASAQLAVGALVHRLASGRSQAGYYPSMVEPASIMMEAACELPLESWRVRYAASGWMAAILSNSTGDIKAAELCRRLVL